MLEIITFHTRSAPAHYGFRAGAPWTRTPQPHILHEHLEAEGNIREDTHRVLAA